jgi:hypothetical protein
MKPELQQIFDNTPEDDPRSKLDPYRELILRWRRQGRSYRRICQLVTEQCSIKVSLATLHGFIERRSRPRKAQLEPMAELITPLMTYPPGVVPKQSDLPPASSQTIASTDKYAADRERMRRHKAQPITPQPEKRFSYTDEDSLKPL